MSLFLSQNLFSYSHKIQNYFMLKKHLSLSLFLVFRSNEKKITE